MRTILHLWDSAVGKYGKNVFFLEKSGGIYKSYSYGEVDYRIRSFACELHTTGAEPGDRVAIIAMGCRDWVVSELGLLFAGCVSVPMSPKLDKQELRFRLEHSGTNVVIVGSIQYPILTDMLHAVKNIKRIIILGDRTAQRAGEVNIEEFISSGEKKFADERYRNELKRIFEKTAEDDLAVLSYTSGTTSDPKGVMLSHKNMYVNTRQSQGLYPVTERDVMLLILPIDHSFAHTAAMYTLITVGGTLASVDQGKSVQDFLKNIPLNIKEVRPTILLSVPALAKSFRKNIEAGVKSKGNLVWKLFSTGLKTAYKYFGEGWDRGNGSRALYCIPYMLFDKIVFSKIRAGFGGRLRNFVGGGALLDVDLQRFFMAVGIPMFQGYGLTEASPVISANTFKKVKIGSSGQPVGDLEIKIIDENRKETPGGEAGEICVKGDNVMTGYYKNPCATSETIRDSWLHTGDLGFIDRDGFLHVLGRFKSLLIGTDGEKYSPEGIEDSIPATSGIIEQVMLYNDHKPFTIALIFPDIAAVKSELERKSIKLYGDKCIHEAIDLIQEALSAYLPGGKYQDLFSSRWIPSKFAVLVEGFTEQNTFLNSSLKMVRPRITAHYKRLIDSLYSDDCKDCYSEYNVRSMNELLGLRDRVLT